MEEETEASEQQDELRRLTESLPTAVSLFSALSQENRNKLLQSLATIFDLHVGATRLPAAPEPRGERGSAQSGHFSEDRSLSAKDFVMQKQPRTDVERVACLA